VNRKQTNTIRVGNLQSTNLFSTILIFDSTLNTVEDYVERALENCEFKEALTIIDNIKSKIK
jgi:hypothetical protein